MLVILALSITVSATQLCPLQPSTEYTYDSLNVYLFNSSTVDRIPVSVIKDVLVTDQNFYLFFASEAFTQYVASLKKSTGELIKLV